MSRFPSKRGKASASRRGKKAQPSASSNRRLTPEEQLVRNISAASALDSPQPRKGKGHAKPLANASTTKGNKKAKATGANNRTFQAFGRAFQPLRKSLTGEWLGGPDIIHHLPFATFLGALFIGYIYLQYRYEYDERAIKEGRIELRDLRHHEQSLRGRFESQLQRSRLDEAVADMNLHAPEQPPVILPDAPAP